MRSSLLLEDRGRRVDEDVRDAPVRVEEGEPTRSKIRSGAVAALVRRGLAVRSVSPEQSTLEDVFIELTSPEEAE